MEDSMCSLVRSTSLAIVIAAASRAALSSQTPRPPQSPYLAPADSLVAVRSGRMFDAMAGTMLNNQIILIKGDRIADVGPSVQIPPGARVIDLGGATVLPGMIDAHVHNAGRGDSVEMKTIVMVQSAARDLDAGFTTTVDMDSRGGFGTVELRNAINAGLIKGPRMQVAGQSLNPRASAPYASPGPGFYSGFTEGKNINGPWLARAAVRESKLHGVDWIKIYTTQDFVGEDLSEFKSDGSLVASPSLTFEEVQAVVDEAHRMGLKVACHTYGGDGMRSCINSGVDLSMHVTELYKDDGLVNTLLQNKLPIMITIDDLVGLDAGDKRLLANLGLTGNRAVTRLAMAELTFKKLLKAGVPLVFGSGAVAGDGAFPHGKQADQFAWMVKWGMTSAQALQSVFMTTASVLNYNWANRVGSVEKGKFADIIAVAGNPLTDVTEMERVKFVMKGGVVMKNELAARPAPSTAAR
jgi:imidazolonepropionase-like amidohydrolase